MSLPDWIPGPAGYDVLPIGRHRCSLDELEEAFVSGRDDEFDRREILEDWHDFRRMQEKVGLVPVAYWIDGGFVTGKVGTSDIDVVTIYDARYEPDDWDIAEPWIQPGPRWQREPAPHLGRTLRVDAYGVVKVPAEDGGYAQYIEGVKYWDRWFRLLRETEAVPVKGYVEVRL